MRIITAHPANPRCAGGIISGDEGVIVNGYNNAEIIGNTAHSFGAIAGHALYINTIEGCYATSQTSSGYGSNGNATIDASTKLLSTNVTVGSYTGNNLLDALNAYVEANPGNGYLNWVEGPDGWPVFGTIKN